MQIIWGSSHSANCNNKHVSPIRGWWNRWLDHMGQEQVDLINLSFNGGNDVRGVMSPEIESSKAKQARWRVTVIRYKCVCVCVCERKKEASDGQTNSQTFRLDRWNGKVEVNVAVKATYAFSLRFNVLQSIAGSSQASLWKAARKRVQSSNRTSEIYEEGPPIVYFPYRGPLTMRHKMIKWDVTQHKGGSVKPNHPSVA